MRDDLPEKKKIIKRNETAAGNRRDARRPFLRTQTNIRNPVLLPLDLPCQDGIDWFFKLNAGNDIIVKILEADDARKIFRFYFE